MIVLTCKSVYPNQAACGGYLQLLFTLCCIFLIGSLLPGDVDADSQKQESVLRIVAWDVYADPEHRDKTIGFREFETEHGVRIEFTPLNNLDEIVSAAESPTAYDIFIISNEGIKILHDMGLVLPLDLSKIPHYQDLHFSLRYNEWSQFDSRVYAVPWAWGPTGLLFDASVISDPVSWNVLWDPRYKGRVSLWDDVSMIWVAALSLGYHNVYNLTRQQLAEVKRKLLALNEQVYGYYSGEQEALEYILDGKAVVLNSWFDPSGRLREHERNFKMVIPREGAVGMFDSYLISGRTDKADIAHAYINNQLRPMIQRQMVRITGLSPANIETMGLLTPYEIKSLHLDEADYFNRMILWDVMPRKHLYEAVLKEVREEFMSHRQPEIH